MISNDFHNSSQSRIFWSLDANMIAFSMTRVNNYKALSFSSCTYVWYKNIKETFLQRKVPQNTSKQPQQTNDIYM